jgi:putative sigma-54 modulation protein
MKLDFTGRHFTVTPAIKKFAKEQIQKIEKILEGRGPASAHFILAIEKYRHVAEVKLTLRDTTLTSQATTDDMYTAITQALDKVGRQVTKRKDKTEDKKRVSVKEVAAQAEAEPAPAKGKAKAAKAANGKADAKDAAKPRVIPTRRYAVKPMTTDDAVVSLGADEQFIVFQNVESNRIGVLYRRKDGNFGLIEP